MKKIILFIAVCLALTSCYDDYVFDYEYSAVYTAYQYDLRTFIPGEEDLDVSFTAALAGVIDNTKDRSVKVVIDNSLLSADLSSLSESDGTSSFTALDGLTGKGAFGAISQSYVKTEVAAAGLSGLTALPASYYTAEPDGDLVIASGNHTAKMKLTPTSKMFEDEKMLKPYYALAFRIDEADADKVPSEMSFQIMAVKIENSFYGNWYHGGRTVVVNNSTGDVISDNYYNMTLPQADDKVYTLTTETANSVLTDKFASQKGQLRLTFGDDGEITVEDPSQEKDLHPINGQSSCHNKAKLLQDRKIFLNYAWNNGDGTSTYVTDTLAFRNRIRDGISEWQDENPAHYE